MFLLTNLFVLQLGINLGVGVVVDVVVDVGDGVDVDVLVDVADGVVVFVGVVFVDEFVCVAVGYQPWCWCRY
jgi:hypothetical protein